MSKTSKNLSKGVKEILQKRNVELKHASFAAIWHRLFMAYSGDGCLNFSGMQPETTVCAKYNVSVKNLNAWRVLLERNGVDWWEHALTGFLNYVQVIQACASFRDSKSPLPSFPNWCSGISCACLRRFNIPTQKPSLQLLNGVSESHKSALVLPLAQGRI